MTIYEMLVNMGCIFIFMMLNYYAIKFQVKRLIIPLEQGIIKLKYKAKRNDARINLMQEMINSLIDANLEVRHKLNKIIGPMDIKYE